MWLRKMDICHVIHDINLTATMSLTARQSPAVNPIKRESQRAQLQYYFLEEILTVPLQLIIA